MNELFRKNTLKKIYMKYLNIIAILFITALTQAQIVTIPDANFKNALVNTNCVDIDGDGDGDANADLNNDGEIQVSEAEAILSLVVGSNSIDSLEGIQSFVNLTKLHCGYNDLTTLDLSQNPNLEVLYCNSNLLATLVLTQNPNLEDLWCYDNDLSNLNLKNGRNQILTVMRARTNPNLYCILVENINYAENAPGWYKDPFVSYINS